MKYFLILLAKANLDDSRTFLQLLLVCVHLVLDAG